MNHQKGAGLPGSFFCACPVPPIRLGGFTPVCDVIGCAAGWMAPALPSNVTRYVEVYLFGKFCYNALIVK